ncbi:MAG: hypothetical protein K6A72_04030 [Lachnospiraceae bacterium]|nr:hypothetical protein [Lachnospiraceae bacterium]
MDDTKFCPSCGDQVPVTTKYCDNCGYAFPKETIPGASVYTPPVMNVQPVVNNAPAVNAEPVVNNTPVENVQPTVNSTPVTNAQPVVNNTPVENIQPVAGNTPVVNAEPAVNNTPAENVQPTVNSTPVTNVQPVVNNAPVENIQPVASNTPAVNAEPVVNNTPAENVPTEAKDAPVENTEPVADSTPVTEDNAAPVTNAQPEVNTAQEIAAAPVADNTQADNKATETNNAQQSVFTSQPAYPQMGNQFDGAQMQNSGMNGPKMAGPQTNTPQMNGQQPGGPVLMNPAYATATPPEKPKGHGCLIAVLIAIMVIVIIVALAASALLATQLEGIDEIDDLFSGASIGGTHSIELSDTETVYMEVGDTHTITVENIDDFFSPRDIKWEVAGGGYYSNDIIRISDNYDGSVTVTALNPGKTSIVVTGKNVDKEDGYVVKIDVAEKSLEYGDSLSSGEFDYAGTAWETEWAQYYFVNPENPNDEIMALENDWGLGIMGVNDACLMMSDYMCNYAYGTVTCSKVSENDLYASQYYNDIYDCIVPGAEYYWFTYVPELEIIGYSQASGNAYDVIFMFQPDGSLVIYDSGFAMLSSADAISQWPSYADLDSRFNVIY